MSAARVDALHDAYSHFLDALPLLPLGFSEQSRRDMGRMCGNTETPHFDWDGNTMGISSCATHVKVLTRSDGLFKQQKLKFLLGAFGARLLAANIQIRRLTARSAHGHQLASSSAEGGTTETMPLHRRPSVTCA